MPQLDKLSFVTQIFWLSLFFFSLYFFVVNFFVSNIFRGLQLKAIIHKNCTFITEGGLPLDKLKFNTLIVSYLNLLHQGLIRLGYFLNRTSNIKTNRTIPIFVLNSEINSIEEELYFSDTLTLLTLRDFANEI